MATQSISMRTFVDSAPPIASEASPDQVSSPTRIDIPRPITQDRSRSTRKPRCSLIKILKGTALVVAGLGMGLLGVIYSSEIKTLFIPNHHSSNFYEYANITSPFSVSGSVHPDFNASSTGSEMTGSKITSSTGSESTMSSTAHESISTTGSTMSFTTSGSIATESTVSSTTSSSTGPATISSTASGIFARSSTTIASAKMIDANGVDRGLTIFSYIATPPEFIASFRATHPYVMWINTFIDMASTIDKMYGFAIFNSTICPPPADALHFNPGGTQHGRGSDRVRHAGDLGPAFTTSTGFVFGNGNYAYNALLSFDPPNNPIGLALVVRGNEDGSQPIGDQNYPNPVNTVLCGIIERGNG